MSVTDPCAVTLSEPDSFNRNGGDGTVTVQTGEGCSWAASTDVFWITLVGAFTGIGPDTITFVVDALDVEDHFYLQ